MEDILLVSTVTVCASVLILSCYAVKTIIFDAEDIFDEELMTRDDSINEIVYNPDIEGFRSLVYQ